MLSLAHTVVAPAVATTEVGGLVTETEDVTADAEQPLALVTVKEYIPDAAAVEANVAGFKSVEEKLLGPDQE